MSKEKPLRWQIAKISFAIAASCVLLGFAAFEYFIKPRFWQRCPLELAEIKAAKQAWAADHKKHSGDIVTFDDLIPVYLQGTPTCWRNGSYSLGKVGEDPTCSISGKGHEICFILNYASDATNLLGQKVFLTSHTTNGPLGALVEFQGQPVAIEGLDQWLWWNQGKEVKVYGILSTRTNSSATGLKQMLVIKNASWNKFDMVYASGSACINYLRQWDGAKDQWAMENNRRTGDTPKFSDVYPYCRRWPVCPDNGTFSLGKISEAPRCSVEVHELHER